MGTLSAQAIAGYAQQAGFAGKALSTMVAIILAESSGNPLAHNTDRTTGDNSYGLAQINMIDELGPTRRAQFGITSNEQLFDPATNLRAAYIVSGGGQNFTPWSAFKSGAYIPHLADVLGKDVGIADLPGLAGGVIDDTASKVADAVAGAFGAAVEPFVTGLKRLSIIGLAVLGGVALIVAGAWRGVKAGA